MNQYQQIRMYYEQEHRSIRWFARELHCSRDTVRKYIKGDSVPWNRKPGSGRKSVISDEVDRLMRLDLVRRIDNLILLPYFASKSVYKLFNCAVLSEKLKKSCCFKTIVR